MKEINHTPKIIQLPKVEDERGNLSFIEGGNHAPFAIQRAYWIYDVPGGEMRGSHAFRTQEEMIVALSGSFDVVLHDGKSEQRIHLSRSYQGVYVPPMHWRTLENFSTNSLGLILSSTHFTEEDYIRDFEQMCQETLMTHPSPISIPQSGKAPFNVLSQKDVYTLDDCRIITLPKYTELRRGWLTPIEEQSEILPFAIKRVFYIYDIPSGAIRGAHAHYKSWQFIVAASSCFEVVIDDGKAQRRVRLDRPYTALLIPPGIWCHLHDFSSAAVALVLTSELYEPEDYICDYEQFINYRKHLVP